jgi:menaquinol-cytochrome c reductase cytochrome b/c subunit
MAETTPAQAEQPAEEPRRRVAEVARRTPGRAAARERDETVFVWPNLLIIEFIAALLMLLTLMVLSWLVNAPLEAHANPDRTPNPSKAPWYFLNLQELLLHMHPALAGVLVPTAALIAIAAIPYIDRDTSDVGKWVPQPNAIPIIIFSTIYTSVLIPIMLLLDEEQTCGICGLKRFLGIIGEATGMHFLSDVLISGVILPTIIMLGPVVILVIILRRVWNANLREVIIGLFTGFVVTFLLLTISGTVFRGPGMHLYWPWDMPPRTD